MVVKKNREVLLKAFGLTLSFFIVELIGGLLSGSLALTADSFHMLTDVFAIGISLFAVIISSKPRTAKRTFGYHRVEIIAALLNGMVLTGMAVFLIFNAYRRVLNPREIKEEVMVPVAVTGLIINILTAFLLYSRIKDNINIKSAFLHVVGDTASSVGTVTGGILIAVTGLPVIDPLITFFISLLILFSTWGIIKDALEILTESAPREIDASDVIRSLWNIPGVKKVHDFHIWTLKPGFITLTSHLLIEKESNHEEVLLSASRLLKEKYKIEHFTIQVEKEMCSGESWCEEMDLDAHKSGDVR